MTENDGKVITFQWSSKIRSNVDQNSEIDLYPDYERDSHRWDTSNLRFKIKNSQKEPSEK